MPLAGFPSIMTVDEWKAYWRSRGVPVTETGPALRDRYWTYVKNHGGPNFFEQAAARAPVTPTPPIPDMVTALLTQRDALPDIYNPQRHTFAATAAAELEGLGYADSGTTRIDAKPAVGADGKPSGNVKYIVFRGADGRLYRQAYMSVMNQGAQRGSLYTSGTSDEVAQGKQALDMARQNILMKADSGQDSLTRDQSGTYTDLTTKWQQGVSDYNAQAPQTVAAIAPPPTAPKPPASAKPKIMTRAQWITYHQKNKIPVKGTYEQYLAARK